tara:strand:- start:129 stop:2780 length:2652 start_codon:yes stop_codon:yes gene_type:complete
MTPFQQMLLGTVPSASKTYVDDVFRTFLYNGTGSSHTISNGLDLSGEGGMVWAKSRNNSWTHMMMDTVRGGNKVVFPDKNDVEATDSNLITSFNSNGYTAGSDGSYGSLNHSGTISASWSFRKAPGFFDIVTWDGDNTNPRQIAHNLGCVPGLIMIKAIENAYAMTDQSWNVYHRSLTNSHYLRLDTDVAKVPSSNFPAEPTATHFTVGYNYPINVPGAKYVAYLFAGGSSGSTSEVKLLCCKSSASATASDTGNTITATGVSPSSDSPGTTSGCCEFTGSANSYMDVDGSSDFAFGTGDFTVEMYVNSDGNGTTGYYRRIYQTDGPTGNQTNNFQIAITPNSGYINVWTGGTAGTGPVGELDISGTSDISSGGWHHVAVVRISGIVTLYVDGIAEASINWLGNVTGNSGSPRPRIGSYDGNSGNFDGKISNLRVTKGFGIYSSQFFWGNNNTGVDFTTTTYPPDAESLTFGESEDKEIIRCGSYRGDSSNVVDINLGWEPSFILVKNVTTTSWWLMIDNMRGTPTGGYTEILVANEDQAENNYSNNYANFTSTGFQAAAPGNGNISDANEEFVYLAVRMADGAVGKPASAGTDVFALDTGNNSATVPCFDSGFPVDWAFRRNPSSTQEWYTQYRMMDPDDGLQLDSDALIQSGFNSTLKFDSSVGWGVNMQSTYQSWMWKRGQGFDVVFYDGNSAGSNGRVINHSLNAVPEMMVVKRRTGGSGDRWAVYHKDMGNTKYLRLDTNNGPATDTIWDNTTPTSTHFTVGNDSKVNNSSGTYLAMLFSSVSGISKVGSYTGTDSNPGPTITTGFQPRFIMIKCSNQNGTNWLVLDSLRGFDNYSWLNLQNAQENTLDILDVSSTGFTIKVAYTDSNVYEYIYYAHA